MKHFSMERMNGRLTIFDTDDYPLRHWLFFAA